ncbi:hypothetical protein HWV62_28328 [Athelia sp. TMB]|nr:hypothetical protein HWV62_28328 [Athelia sp. TMB]
MSCAGPIELIQLAFASPIRAFATCMFGVGLPSGLFRQLRTGTHSGSSEMQETHDPCTRKWQIYIAKPHASKLDIARRVLADTVIVGLASVMLWRNPTTQSSLPNPFTMPLPFPVPQLPSDTPSSLAFPEPRPGLDSRWASSEQQMAHDVYGQPSSSPTSPNHLVPQRRPAFPDTPSPTTTKFRPDSYTTTKTAIGLAAQSFTVTIKMRKEPFWQFYEAGLETVAVGVYLYATIVLGSTIFLTGQTGIEYTVLMVLSLAVIRIVGNVMCGIRIIAKDMDWVGRTEFRNPGFDPDRHADSFRTLDIWSFAGNLLGLFQDGLAYNFQLIEKYGGVFKVFGLLGDEVLYVSDPRALHSIVVKEQETFEETDMFIEANRLIFGEGLISTQGNQHTKQRKLLNPVFSLANMRDLLPIVQPIADKLLAMLVSQLPADYGNLAPSLWSGGTDNSFCPSDSKEVDMVPWISRGSLEYVCQATMGYSFNALDPDMPHEYADAVRRLTPTVLKLVWLRPLIPFVIRNFSLFWRNKLVDWLPITPLKEMRSITDVMYRTSRRIFEEKKAELGPVLEHEKGSRGKDIMSIMRFDNTAVALSRVLHILASEPAMQARLRTEIRQAQLDHGSDHLPYGVLVSLPYLDAIVRETLRMHPPTSMLSRIARKATTLPLAHPVETPAGEKVSSVFVPEGTDVIISILAANHNKEVWGSDASVFRPERWLKRDGAGSPGDESVGEKPEQDGVRYPGVYGSTMTFLGGGRACIAFKFAEMEIKQILLTLLSKVHFALPSSVDETGRKKEIYWKMNGIDVPVVRPPLGDGQTGQLPLDLRLLRDDDFM